MDQKELCTLLSRHLGRAIGTTHPRREDSRAFGAMLEQRVSDSWPTICADLGATPDPKPGRRSIYDLAARMDGVLIALDIKTKDSDDKTYSDGGVCSVDNLVQFLVRTGGRLLMAEIAHRSDGQHNRHVVAVDVVPIHLLPEADFRIENLGTGQLRLNRPLREMLPTVVWSRTLPQFLDFFTDLAIAHFDKVGAVAQQRSRAMQAFRAGGYTKLSLP